MIRRNCLCLWTATLALVIAMTLATLVGATSVLAQTRAASAAITIERALTVNSVRPMMFGGHDTAQEEYGPDVLSEAIIEVTGDPGRVYRITLPAVIEADGYGSTIDTLTLRSETSGDITSTLTARMSEKGSDRLYIGGRLRNFQGLFVTGVTSAVPMGIDYE